VLVVGLAGVAKFQLLIVTGIDGAFIGKEDITAVFANETAESVKVIFGQVKFVFKSGKKLKFVGAICIPFPERSISIIPSAVSAYTVINLFEGSNSILLRIDPTLIVEPNNAFTAAVLLRVNVKVLALITSKIASSSPDRVISFEEYKPFVFIYL
jgi:hypothetical protein